MGKKYAARHPGGNRRIVRIGRSYYYLPSLNPAPVEIRNRWPEAKLTDEVYEGFGFEPGQGEITEDRRVNRWCPELALVDPEPGEGHLAWLRWMENVFGDQLDAVLNWITRAVLNWGDANPQAFCGGSYLPAHAVLRAIGQMVPNYVTTPMHWIPSPDAGMTVYRILPSDCGKRKAITDLIHDPRVNVILEEQRRLPSDLIWTPRPELLHVDEFGEGPWYDEISGENLLHYLIERKTPAG